MVIWHVSFSKSSLGSSMWLGWTLKSTITHIFLHLICSPLSSSVCTPTLLVYCHITRFSIQRYIALIFHIIIIQQAKIIEAKKPPNLGLVSLEEARMHIWTLPIIIIIKQLGFCQIQKVYTWKQEQKPNSKQARQKDNRSTKLNSGWGPLN